MKKTILSIFLVAGLSLTCLSQTVDPKKPPVPTSDTAAQTQLILPADSVAFISANDLALYLQLLKQKLTVDQFMALNPEQTISDFFRWAVQGWNEKQKQKPKPKGK